MKTADQYIKEIKSSLKNDDPIKAVRIFNDAMKAVKHLNNPEVIVEVHKECGMQIVEVMQSDVFKEEMERQAQEHKKAKWEEQERKGVWCLSRWPELKDRGVLGNGDLIQLSIGECLDRYHEGNTSFNEVMLVNNVWDGLFSKSDPVSGSLKNIKRTHNGLIFFEGKAMYIDCGDRAPIPVFPDSSRRFKHCTISVLSKAS